jgi:enterochelin esterase-like enzyme
MKRSDMNLLLFNNADDLEKIQAKKIIDSLYDNNLIEQLELVGIHGKEEEYGLSDLADAFKDKNGRKADKYNSFVINELLPFIKKRSKIRKFKSITICGGSLAGISAFDIAWHNANKIDKVGIFSGDFMYAGDQPTDSGPMNAVFESLKLSGKRPTLQYWFYATESNDSSILKNTIEFIDILNKKKYRLIKRYSILLR